MAKNLILAISFGFKLNSNLKRFPVINSEEYSEGLELSICCNHLLHHNNNKSMFFTFKTPYV